MSEQAVTIADENTGKSLELNVGDRPEEVLLYWGGEGDALATTVPELLRTITAHLALHKGA